MGANREKISSNEDIEKFLGRKGIVLLSDLKRHKDTEYGLDAKIMFPEEFKEYLITILANDFCFKIYEKNDNGPSNIVADMSSDWVKYLSNIYENYADAFKNHFRVGVSIEKSRACLQIVPLKTKIREIEEKRDANIKELNELKEIVDSNHEKMIQGKTKD